MINGHYGSQIKKKMGFFDESLPHILTNVFFYSLVSEKGWNHLQKCPEARLAGSKLVACPVC